MCMLTSCKNPGLNQGRTWWWLGARSSGSSQGARPSCSLWQLLETFLDFHDVYHNSTIQRENRTTMGVRASALFLPLQGPSVSIFLPRPHSRTLACAESARVLPQAPTGLPHTGISAAFTSDCNDQLLASQPARSSPQAQTWPDLPRASLLSHSSPGRASLLSQSNPRRVYESISQLQLKIMMRMDLPDYNLIGFHDRLWRVLPT